jgi:hypothetical protein
VCVCVCEGRTYVCWVRCVVSQSVGPVRSVRSVSSVSHSTPFFPPPSLPPNPAHALGVEEGGRTAVVLGQERHLSPYKNKKEGSAVPQEGKLSQKQPTNKPNQTNPISHPPPAPPRSDIHSPPARNRRAAASGSAGAAPGVAPPSPRARLRGPPRRAGAEAEAVAGARARLRRRCCLEAPWVGVRRRRGQGGGGWGSGRGGRRTCGRVGRLF